MAYLADMRRELREKYEKLKANPRTKASSNPSNREELCRATEHCKAVTPYGTVEGRKTSLGREVNRLVTVEDLQKIAEKSKVEPSRYTEAISFSTCPTQTYGGKVRLVFDAERLRDKLEPVCYITPDGEANKIEKGIDEEAMEEAAKKREWAYHYVRAKYAVSPDIYARECQYEARESIPLERNLKRVEYWIGGVKPGDFNVGCERIHPHVAGAYSRPEDYLEHIQRAKRIAEKLGVPFEVKSCFNKLRAGWYIAIELNEENLRKFAEGEIPPSKPEKEIPETCVCS